MASVDAIRVNRAPVLTLWASIVAERLGYSTATALTLGRAVAGYSAQAKARRLGLVEEGEVTEKRERPKVARETVFLLGRRIPIMATDDGQIRAEDHGKPASERSTLSYIRRAFGDKLDAVRAAMEDLAASYPPDDLNRIGFHLYERFRPEAPDDVSGWGAKGELKVGRIRNAAI
ncbi:hypothetical protein [Rhodoblastus sp.]|uniref:hypothetical protein n=1 Tax=Rhodoblastus sp. TaxID=1962975 RepID=UPI003F98630C